MTNKLVVIINRLKYQKLRKFYIRNEISCTKLQLPPELLTRGLRPPRSPFSLSSTEFVETPPNKIPGLRHWNEEAMAHWGLVRQKQTNNLNIIPENPQSIAPSSADYKQAVYIQNPSPKVWLRSTDITFRNSKWLVHKNACEIFPYQKSQRPRLTSRIWQKRETVPLAYCYWRRNSTATFTAYSLMTAVNDGPNASFCKQYGMQETSVPRRNIRWYHDREHTVPQAICKG